MKALGVNSLPDNPSANGYSASQIKGAISKPTLRLFDLLKGIADGSIALIDSDPSGLSAAVLSEYDGQLVVYFDADTKDCSVYYIESGTATQIGESFKTTKEKVSELFSYFTDGKANKAIGDADGDAIKDTYAHSIGSSENATSGDKVSIYSKNGGSLGSVDLTNAHHAYNADNASKATKDGNGNVITETYATKKELSETNWMSTLTALQEALTAEVTNRQTADSQLQTAIDNESGYRADADKLLQENIDSEATTRSEADSLLQSNIDSEATARKNADTLLQGNIDSEASSRKSADSQLQSNIDSEASARKSADDNLQTQIDTINATQNVVDIVGTYAELTAYGTADLHANDKIEVLTDEKQDDADTIYSWDGSAWTLVGSKAAYYSKSEVDAKHTEQDTALANEVTRAQTAEGTLQDNIDAESTRAQTAESALQSNIDAEASRAKTAEAANASTITTETARAKAAETANANAITAEGTARANKDTQLQGNIDSEASARANADTTLQGNIDSEKSLRVAADEALQDAIDTESSTRSTADTALGTRIDNEATDRKNADATLQSNIDAEATARTSADTALSTKLTAEATARSDADKTLHTNITNEATARSTADANLQTNITTEANRAKAAEEALQGSIDNESAARSTKDTELEESIASESSARSTADNTLQANIDSEATARKAADADLQSQIDAMNASQNFVATVSTYASLSSITTTNLDTEDCVLVLQDETHDSQAYVYKWNGTSFAGVGPLGDSYTKAETDSLLSAEKTARESADTALDGRVTALEGKAVDYASASASTLSAGSSATASASIAGGVLSLSFGIPKGEKGDKGDTGKTGATGATGAKGDTGATGPQGEQGVQGEKGDTGTGISSVVQTTTSTADGGANVWTITLTNSSTANFTVRNGSKGSTGAQGEAGSITINNVETLPAGSSAYVTNVGDSQNAILNIGIPKGADYDSSVLAGYLPLTGGTISGIITASQFVATSSVHGSNSFFNLWEDSDGGNFLLTSYSENVKAEMDFYGSSAVRWRFYNNSGSWGSIRIGPHDSSVFENGLSIYPETRYTSNLGLSTNYWTNLYVTNLYQNGTAYDLSTFATESTVTNVLNGTTSGTFTGSLSGNATTATTLANSRSVRTNLASTSAASFNGSANISPGVTGILPVSNGGTGASSLSSITVGNASTANKATSADYATSAGSATSSVSSSYSSYPEGFTDRTTSATWGVQTGTVITTWEDESGGSVAWRKNCPGDGETSLMIDGRFYQDEGRYMCLDTSNYGSYAIPKTSYEEWTFTLSDGTTVTKKVAIV